MNDTAVYERILADAKRGYEMRPDLPPAPGYFAYLDYSMVPCGMCPMTAACVANGWDPDSHLNGEWAHEAITRIFGINDTMQNGFYQGYDSGRILVRDDRKLANEYGLKARQLFPSKW